MIKPSISLQELRRKLYLKAKAEQEWRFWGLYVHVCKSETLREAWRLAKANKGAAGIDGVTFEAIEQSGLEEFLEDIRQELVAGTYVPLPLRERQIPKGSGGMRTLKIPAVRDRIVQGALKLILEPIFDADFQPGSFGYRPKRSAHQAVHRIAKGLISRKTRVIDADLSAYFDNIRHDRLLAKVSKRINDSKIMHLLKLILKSSGKRGVSQGGVISPLLSNIYLNDVDKMLERAKRVTMRGRYTHIEYARFADDLVVLVDYHTKWDWLIRAVLQRLKQELGKLCLTLNTTKSRVVDLEMGGNSFDFLGFNFRLRDVSNVQTGLLIRPRSEARTALLRKLKKIVRSLISKPAEWVVNAINPVLRGWINYFRIGNSSRCFDYVKWWVERKVRRHLMRARLRQGFGWKRWSTDYIYRTLGLFDDYQVRYFST